jgi:hypothetical protein
MKKIKSITHKSRIEEKLSQIIKVHRSINESITQIHRHDRAAGNGGSKLSGIATRFP